VINRFLYAALRSLYGEVRVTSPDTRRIESQGEVVTAGEHYNVCCPFCGDTRHRLSISYRWLDVEHSTSEWGHLANCFNEGCREVYGTAFRDTVRERAELASVGLLSDVPAAVEPTYSPDTPIAAQRFDLPNTAVPVLDLPQDHAAYQFIRMKYPGIPSGYMARHYGLLYCEHADPRWPRTRSTLVFPVHDQQGLLGWQARALDPQSKTRWYIPPGLILPVYNLYRVPRTSTLVLAEGIPAAIACGPTGVAIFNKALSAQRCKAIAEEFSSVVIATDPETFLPDPRSKGRVHAHALRDTLARFMTHPPRMVRYPESVMTIAQRKLAGEDLSVPDPADLGLAVMRGLINAAAA